MLTKNVVNSLKKFGITAAPYAKPPNGKDVFVISIKPKRPEGIIQVNQGKAKIDIHGSKTNRQAVITVVEEARVITRNVKEFIAAPYSGSPAVMRRWKPDQEAMERLLRNRFPLQVPGNPTWSFSGVKMERRKSTPSGWVVSGVVTAKVGKKTTNHFLLGVDESYNFIAPLREKPSSVEHAYKLLKPDLRPGSLRQGEWFFEPVKKDEAVVINAQALNKNVREHILGGSTHRAKSAVSVRKPKAARGLYARGYVTDSRKGHHQPLWLPTWHKVVRNKEIVFRRPRNATRASRRRMSFD